MVNWKKGSRHESWASNPNLAVYIFFLLFAVWLGFQVWSRMPGGPPPPSQLDPMVMAALGVAISAKSVERGQKDKEIEHDVKENKQTTQENKDNIEIGRQKISALEDVAKESHPDVVDKHSPPLTDGKHDEPN